MGPDWSLLPPELLESISEKITSMDQYVHFRAVCQPWRQACKPNPRRITPPIPWLSLTLVKKIHSISTLSPYYDFSKSRMHDIDLPGVNWKGVCGHSCGWIVLEKDKELSFVNPITRETKSGCFPSLAVPPTVLGFARNKRTTKPQPSDGFDVSIITKVVLTSSPTDRDCIVVAEFMTGWELGFCRIGDSCWTILKLREYGHGSRHMSDFKCRNNSVYVIDNVGCLIVYDLRNLSKEIIIDKLSGARFVHKLRLVVGEGELDGVPLIVKYAEWGSDIFEVFKRLGSKWRKVRNIGNVVLLLSYRTCEIYSLGNIQLNGWEGNRICYHIRCEYPFDDRFCNIKIKMVSIANGSVKEVTTNLGLFSSDAIGNLSWFTPSLY